MAPVDQVVIRHSSAVILIAPLELRILDGNLAERIGVRIEKLDAFAVYAREGLRLRLFHGIEQRVEQVQRDHHEHAGCRVGSFQLPGDAGGVARNLIGARLRIDAVGFDVALQADGANRVRIGIGVRQVRTLLGFGLGEDDLGADFETGANGLGEGIGRLDKHVGGLFILRIEEQRHFRQALDGADPILLQADREFEGDYLRARAEDGLTHLDREFEAAGHDREIGKPAALQAAGFRNRLAVVWHSAALPLRGRG